MVIAEIVIPVEQDSEAETDPQRAEESLTQLANDNPAIGVVNTQEPVRRLILVLFHFVKSKLLTY